MSFCKTLSTKGTPIDYRPATQHALFKLDSTFDFRFGALRHCKVAINKFARQVFWGYHKTLFSSLVDNIKKEKQSDAIHITFVTTGLSDSDRSFYINEFLVQLTNQNIGMVVDVMNTRNASAREILSMIADQLNYSTIDPVHVNKTKGATNISFLSKEQINETPLKAISSLFTTKTNNFNKYTTQKSNDKSHHTNTLILILRHCEMIDVHTLDNLFLLLNGSDVDFNVHIIAYTDTVCPLPIQLSATAQACIHTNITSMVSPWELYETIFGRLYSGRDIPIVFSQVLADAIRRPFEQTDLCITSALHRFELCLVRHFEQPLSLLAMYKETTFLQQMNILSRSERLHHVGGKKQPSSQQLQHGSNSTANPLSRHRSGTLESNIPMPSTSALAVAEEGAREEVLEEDEDVHTVLTTTEADNNTVATTDSAAGTVLEDNERLATTLPGTTTENLSKQRIFHRLGVSAILSLLKPKHLEDTGLTHSATLIISLLELQDFRTRVDNVWFLFLKAADEWLSLQTLRSDLLEQDDQSRFGADMLWAEIHSASISTPANTHIPSGAASTTRGVVGIVHNQLLNKIRENVRTQPLNILCNTLTTLNTILTPHYHDINKDNDNSTYCAFVHAFYEGLNEHLETVEFLLETFEAKGISTKLSLNKMKQIYNNNTSSSTSSSSNNNKIRNERIEVNMQERNLISTDSTTNSNTIHTTTATTSSATNNTTTSSAANAGAGATISTTSIEGSNIVSLDIVTLYTQALIDLINWLATISLQYAQLPIPTHLLAEETNNREIMQLPLSGIVRFHRSTELAILADMNSSLHTTFVSAWEDPSALLLPARDTSPSNCTGSTATATTTNKTCGKRAAGGGGTKNKSEPLRVFSPDTAILYQIFKSSPARDTAAVWFQQFQAMLKTQVSTWEASIHPSDGSNIAGSNKKRKRSNRTLELDDMTVLKARFISALHELERSGFIRCTSNNTTSARGSSKAGGAVIIDRLMFNWV